MKSTLWAQEHERQLRLERERHKYQNDIKKILKEKNMRVWTHTSLMIGARKEPLWTPLRPFEFPKRQRNSQPNSLIGCPVKMVCYMSQIKLYKLHHRCRSNTDAKSKWLLQFWCFLTLEFPQLMSAIHTCRESVFLKRRFANLGVPRIEKEV
jgi:hypothetical protein